MGIGQEFLDPPIPLLNIVNDRIDFDTIAGGQQQAFFHAGIRRQPTERLAHPALRHRQLLANLDRRRLMTESDYDYMHLTTPSRSS